MLADHLVPVFIADMHRTVFCDLLRDADYANLRYIDADRGTLRFLHVLIIRRINSHNMQPPANYESTQRFSASIP